MARISTYTLDQPTLADTVMGTKMPTTSTGSMATRQFTVGSIVGLVNLANVGLNFKWNVQDPLYRVDTTHIGVGGSYTKLRVDFENLTLEEGSTYALLIERNKRPGLRNTSAAGKSYRTGGYKAQSLVEEIEGPYAGRLSEIPITAVTGQLFDFKFDLFFRAAGSPEGFPTPAGYTPKRQLSADTGNVVKVLPIAFKVRKTTGGVSVTSAILGELTLVGIVQSDGPNVEPGKITFKHR